MNKKFEDLRIVFLGTPDFAVASLNALIVAKANVVAVVTMPDKPAGRGMQLQSSPVKKYALEHQIPVLQPEKLKDPTFLTALAAYKADIQVVVAFRMLPEVVWNMPPMGTINVHGSLLPNYRGAAPINWAVMNGDSETGVTTFKLQHQIDTGNILLQDKLEIKPTDNAGTIHDKLMSLGANLLVETIKGLVSETIEERPQTDWNEKLHKHAPKIFKDDMKIDWHQKAQDIYNKIRGLAPYPAAFTQLQGKQVKIFDAHVAYEKVDVLPETVDTDHKSYLRFAAQDGWIYLDELQLEGKKRMTIDAFLRGFRLQ